MEDQFPEGLWTYDQAAAWLGVQKGFVQRLAASGCIQKIKLSRAAVRLDPAEVRAYAEALKERRV